jgi:tuftelin-interacting protein 11
MEDVTEMGKRRIRAVLRSWTPKDGVPAELEKWRKDVSHFTISERLR